MIQRGLRERGREWRIRQSERDAAAPVDELDGQLAEKHVTLELTDAALAWFAEHGYDEKFGARPMARLVQQTLKAPLANELLFGKLQEGGIAKVDVKDGEIVLDCTPAPPKDDDDSGDDGKADGTDSSPLN